MPPWSKKLLGGLAVLVVLVAAAVLWAHASAQGRLEQVHTVHSDPPALSKPTDPEALAASVARGEHLVHARYGCTHCHGEDLGGGLMMEDPAMGRWPAPNLTRGRGGLPADFDLSDWDHIVRHGVRRDGTAAVMPAQDYAAMSDEELVDIVAYIESLPPVDRELPPRSFGPVGTMLLALGKLQLAAETLATRTEHPARPPEEAPTAEFGSHLAQTCIGCHGPKFAGGPIEGGAPDWPPAGNLTPHTDGLADWTFDDFVRLMRKGERPDGSKVKTPMQEVTWLGRGMTETELRALWAFLRTLPATPTPS